jgi:hypothetical protein
MKIPNIKIILANYFDCFGENLATALSLPVHTLHLDLVRCPLQMIFWNLIYFQIAPLSHLGCRWQKYLEK